jgi:putative addiction module component (TIGR02574 family)
MATLLQDLGINKMNLDDRIALAQQIWDSVEAEIKQQALSPAQLAELERRVQAADANPGVGIPWEVVKAKALAR